MSQKISHPVFDGFQTLWVFNPKKQFPLKLNELLVYSALAHADARGQQLKDTDLAWKTGLSRGSIPRILRKLANEELVIDGRTPAEHNGYFFPAKRNKPPEHWSQQLRYWKCLVQCEGSKLQVSDQCVLSYIWWSKITGYDPPNGWSPPYLALILKLTKKTVKDAIGRLQKMCLLKIEGDKWMVPKSLNPIQEAWFLRKDLDAPVKQKVTLGEFEPDIRELGDGYAPGEIVGVTEPVSPRRPVDALSVHQHIGQVLNGQPCDMATRSRIFNAARPELEVVGTDSEVWKPIVERHLQELIAEREAEEAADCASTLAFDDLSDMASLADLYASNMV